MVAGIDSFIFLYGPPAVGKSSVGQALAERLGMAFVDLDEAIERHAGQTIPEIFQTDGEHRFRALERDLLEMTLAEQPAVVALGGGALVDVGNRVACLKKGVVLCLQLDEAVLLERVEQLKNNNRPLLAGEVRVKLKQLLVERREHYGSFENQVEVNGLTIEEVSAQISVQLGRFYLADHNRGSGYPILTGEDVLVNLPALVMKSETDGKIALVSDSNVAPIYMDKIQNSLEIAGFLVSRFQIPAGENCKNLSNLQKLWDGFLAAGLGRKSMVLALGGGVVSDLSGYAAASFMRGIPWGVVSTSLLGMVDASLGGKTGINLPAGKNLVGAFYAPRFVLSDVSTLKTLPVREWSGGLAEVVKHGVIADPGLFELCSQGLVNIRENIGTVVARAVAVKVDVVTKDPFESGVRACLNLGHTIGHAVENLSEYRLSHGEAVSIGTVVEARIAETMGLAKSGLGDEISAVFSGLGLPVEIPPHMERGAVYETLHLDKKRAAGKVQFALPVDIGKVEIGVVVDDLERLLQNV